jgi:hypothetical protein
MIGSNAIRMVLLALIPFLWSVHALTLPTLCAVALVSGTCDVFFQTAEMAYVPGLVKKELLLQANSSVEATRFVAQLTGSGLAGALVQVFGPVPALLVDAGSYLVSVLTLGAVRHREPVPAPVAGSSVRGDIATGARFVWRSLPIRTVSVQGMVLNGLWNASTVPLVLYAIREVHIGALWWALLLAGGSIGAVFGAVNAPRLGKRFGYGPVMLGVACFANIPLFLVPLVDHPLWLVRPLWILGMAAASFGVGVQNPLAMTLRARLTPPEILGRVSATARLMMFAAMPVGAVAGGLLARGIGNRPSLWLITAATVVAAVLLLPIRNMRDIPEEGAAEEPVASDQRPVGVNPATASP